MTDDAGAPRPGGVIISPVVVLCVCVLFVVSGSVGLVYEVAWKHVFSTVFGNTTYAVSVVISVFMAGLAAGSYVLGRLADRARRYLLIYALLQVGIGLSALGVPYALQWAEGLYGVVFRASGSPGLLTLTQVVVSAAVLLAPTFLMGGTLPVLSRFLAARRGLVGPAVGLLYGLNTLGAAGGAFLTGFVLVKELGTLRTVYVAAGVNLLLAVAFLALHAVGREQEEAAAELEPAEEAGAQAALGPGRLRLIVLAVAVSGFVSFSYEVLWTRLLGFKFQTTVYAFSTMLTTFLLGLGLGGVLVGALQRSRAKPDYWRLFGLLEGAIGVCGLGTVLLFSSARPGYQTFAERVVGELASAAAVMVVPTTLMGIAFPLACHLHARGVRETGRSVGRIYVFNTVGAVMGALVTGFVLVRAVGTQRAMALASVLILASGSVILAASPRPGRIPAPWVIACLWAAGLAVWLLTPADFLVNYFLKNQAVAMLRPGEKVTLLGYEEGVEGVVVACRVPEGYKTIAAGSSDVAGTSYVLRTTQKLQAHVPMLIHPGPQRVCQVGFGSGETSRIFASYDVERFDCVEISRAMLDLADRYFRDINGGILEWENFNAIVMDASAYVRYSGQTYDVIANDSIWPHMAGNSALYTLEYFRSGRDHLRPGGIMTSWFPLEMPLQDVKTVLRTFHEVFPHVYVWSSLFYWNKHALLVGSDRPLEVDAARFAERFERFARRDLEAIYLDDPAVLLTCYLADISGPVPELADAPLSTEHKPVLRFMTSRIYRSHGMIPASYALLGAHRDAILGHLTNVESLPDAQQFRAKLQRLHEANDHALAVLMAPRRDVERRRRELLAAVELAPEHPVSRLFAAETARLAGLTAEQVEGLPLDDLKKQARQMLAAARYDDALVALSQWAAREPDSAEPLTALGSCYLLMRRPEEAIQVLARAVVLDTGSADAHYDLGVAYVRAGRVGQALGPLLRAVDLAPGSAEAHAQLGSVYGLLGERGAALGQLQQAVALKPNLADAQRNLGIVLMQMGRGAEAALHLEKSLELGLVNARTHDMLAETYERLGNRPSAERHRRQAQRLRGAPTPPASE